MSRPIQKPRLFFCTDSRSLGVAEVGTLKLDFRPASEYQNNEEVDEVLLWEMIKLKIRDASMKYSKVKMKKMKNEETNIESALATVEEQLEQGVNNKDVLEEQIRCKKNELENIIQ